MEIEEVAAHNADVYNPGRTSAQKRKREKAQDQLRNRIRKRNNGTSTSMVSTRLRSTQRDKGESTLVPGVKPVWDNAKHNSGEEWRDQEARYSTLAHPDRGAGDTRRRQGEVPLTELVGRVMQRRGHATSNSSPMTIRALKPPAPPYAIQHQALIRKIQPISKRKPSSGGPYVVVLNRSSSTKKSDPTETHKPTDLPPLKQQNNSSDVEIATWRPELTTTHEPYVHPNAEDRSVTNYRLQMQQAIKIAELRCDFSTSSKPMHKHAPLPAIQVAYEVADKPQNATVDGKTETTRKLEGAVADTQIDSESIQNAPNESREKINRFTSSQAVLQQMQARRQSKRRKSKGNDFNNPLRTRNRVTSKMKVFKEDLQKTRELSIIQEDQSSISDRLSRLSAGRTSVASFRSVGSLKRIEESEVPGCRRANRLSMEIRGLGVPETEHQECNTDSQSEADDVSLCVQQDTSIASGSACDTSDLDSCNTVSNSDKASSSLCSDASSIDQSIMASNVENSIDNFASYSEEKTVKSQIDKQESVAIVSDDNNDPSSEPDTDNQTPTDVSGSESDVDFTHDHDDVMDSDDNATCTNDPLIYPHHVQSEDIVSSSEPQADKPNESGDSEPATNYEDSQVVMETRLTINKKSVDSYQQADSSRGIAADTFDMKDVILPAETVQ